MSEWKEYFLAEIAEIISNRVSISKANLDNYISTENLIPNFGGVSKSESIPNVPSINSFNEGDTLFSNIRTYFKKVWYSKFNGTVSPDVLVFRSKPQKCTSKFLYYLLCQPEFTEYTVLTSKGAKMPRGDKDAILNYKIAIPSIATQTAIASILSSLDDKIDLLHRQNATLEKMAETLFRQWFVEEAKEDWEEGEIGSVIETTSGGTPSRSNLEFYTNGIIPWVKSKELNKGFLFSTEEKITESGLKNSSAKLLPKNSILIAMYGATVGEYCIINDEMSCNQAICALIPNRIYPYTFLFLFIKSKNEELINMAVGSAQQNISQQLIKKLPILNCQNRINEFHILVEPYFEKIRMNGKQLHHLIQIRDTLLPKLMSGELPIKP